MTRNRPPVWLCALALALAVLWRIIGAPLTGEDFQNVGTALWQARTLLPQRLVRIGQCWLGGMAGADPESQASEPGEDRIALHVYIAQEDRMEQMTLDSYLCGVIAAEMPARNHLEALKAQAVAARTRALKQRAEGGCARHPGADICTDSTHCQGYATLSERKALWGDSWEAYNDRVTQAERATSGETLTYDGELITVFYHAMSGGRTEAAQTVFSENLPYLVSVESEGEEDARGFWEECTLTFEQIAQKLNEAYPEAGLTAQDVRRSLSVSGYTESGRVSGMQVGGMEFSGPAFRAALGLRSTWFSLSSDENGVTFQQRGYGHGVGMSQVGANAMASNGASYADILSHYYPGTALEKP